jgi:hypothetical protein
MQKAAVVNVLIAKRAELAGEIILTRKRLAEMKTDLDHLDATLRQYDPEAVLDDTVAKTWRPPKEWSARGEMKRRILAILRRANGEKLTSRDVAMRLMHEKELDVTDQRLVRLMRKRVATALRGQRDAGAVASEEAFGGWNAWWLVGS